MCGRSSLHDAPVNVLEAFELPPTLPGFEPRFNIAPSQDQWVIASGQAGNPVAGKKRWGLIPSWADDPAIGSRLVNARAESLAERPAFRDSLESRRCVILADGYYEWNGAGRARVPYYFHFEGAAFGMAGLWDKWGSGDAAVETCVIITVDASPAAARIHDRMPAILRGDDAVRWVDPGVPVPEAVSLLAPFEGNELRFHEVSPHVNSVSSEGEECIRPVLSLFQ